MKALPLIEFKSCLKRVMLKLELELLEMSIIVLGLDYGFVEKMSVKFL